MGVDTEIYRCRIGVFNVCMKPKLPKSSKWVRYAPQTKGNDIQFRVFWMCVLIGAQLILAESIMHMAKHHSWRLFVNHDDPYRGLAQVSRVDGFATTPYLVNSDNYYCYMNLAQRLLILSADIETNPGPISDKEAILREIRTSKMDLLEEMKSVKEDIQFIKQEVAAVKTDNVIIKSNMSQVQHKQSEFDKKLTDLQNEIDSVKRENETLQLDVDDLANQLDRKTEIIDSLDKDIDQLESYSRRDTVRVFGLRELANESYENIKQYVIDAVLKVARPDIEWSLKDIVRTHRVGNENANKPDQPRILLIKFLHWDHKMDLYKGRDILREYDIHVGDDLTRRQRQKLKKLAENGKYGYYYKGQLYIKDAKTNTKVESRTFRKAHRRINEVPLVQMQNADSQLVDSDRDNQMEVVHNQTIPSPQQLSDVETESAINRSQSSTHDENI